MISAEIFKAGCDDLGGGICGAMVFVFAETATKTIEIKRCDVFGVYPMKLYHEIQNALKRQK